MSYFCANYGYVTGVSMEFWTSKKVTERKFISVLEKAFKELEIEIDMDYYDSEKRPEG